MINDKNNLMEQEEKIIVMNIGKDIYAFALNELSEITFTEIITPVPGAQDYMEGFIMFRGNITYIFDLKKLFFERTETENFSFIAIFKHQKWLFGFGISSVQKTVSISRKNIIKTKTINSKFTTYIEDHAKKIPLLFLADLIDRMHFTDQKHAR